MILVFLTPSANTQFPVESLTFNPDFKVTTYFEVEYLINGSKAISNLSNGTTFNDLSDL